MADSHHRSYRDMVQSYESELDALVDKGIYKPLFLYHGLVFGILPLIGLVIPRSKGGKYVRRGVFVLCIAIAIEVLQTRRCITGGNGFMLGLITGWWLVWNATLFVFTDLEHDFRRIERKSVNLQPQESVQGENGAGREPLDLINGVAVDSQPPANSNLSNPTRKEPDDNTFTWQSYPEAFSHRLNWSVGLFFNCRGPEWNWRAPHLGPLPRSIHTQLHSGFSSTRIHARDDSAYISGKGCLRAASMTFLKFYFLMDLFKVLTMRDPYFRGVAPADLPPSPPFPFSYLTAHSFLVHVYHRFFNGMGIFITISFVTSLNPIFFLGLSLAFPNASRKLTAVPLGAPWLYPGTFGPWVTPIFDHGLAGCWAESWHQTFRFGFTAAARWILNLLPGHLGSHPHVRPVTYTVVAFSLSGFIHACGSYTQFSDTYPLSGPFLFFSLQPFAIIAEQVFKTLIFPRLPLAGTPRWLRRTANFVFICCWLAISGALAADDFSRGGLWLAEAVPISPLRGLGFGLQGEGWWCWNDPWFRYWSDGTYWGSGIRVL